ncbi:Hypothetical protein A7982_08447 [Minicystis rosea]|nr:Hypothetical protein A7982_08447 [Minicystis rosea]
MSSLGPRSKQQQQQQPRARASGPSKRRQQAPQAVSFRSRSSSPPLGQSSTAPLTRGPRT